ncbi:hypothetical protein V3C99_008602, partial [Haemonchus contortus]
EDACEVKCSSCGLDHNLLLCHQRRQTQQPHKRHRFL